MSKNYTGITLKKIDSSNIDYIGYNLKEQELHILFKNLSHYVYHSVNQYKYDQLMQADSKGKFLNSEIKPYYKFTKRS